MHTIKVIITKYALTSGPIIAEGTPDPQSKTRMLEVNRSGSGFQRTDYYHRQDWQTTKEDAKMNVTERAAQRKLFSQRVDRGQVGREARLAQVANPDRLDAALHFAVVELHFHDGKKKQ